MNRIDLSKHRVQNNVQNALVLLLIFISANASIYSQNDIFLAFVTAVLLSVFILKKKDFDPFIFVIILAWIFINSFSFFVNQTSINSYTLFGFIIKLLLPYFLLKLVGKSFIFRLEKFIYYLTLISLPIFVIQLLFPELFFKFSHLLNFMSGEGQRNFGGWYIGIYMFSGWHVFRNAGFMWEPGAFAFMITLALLIHINKNGVTFDFKNKISSFAVV